MTATTLRLLRMRLCSDSHSGQKQSPFHRMEKGQKASQPPRLKITLIVVSTSTGALLSRYGR